MKGVKSRTYWPKAQTANIVETIYDAAVDAYARIIHTGSSSTPVNLKSNSQHRPQADEQSNQYKESLSHRVLVMGSRLNCSKHNLLQLRGLNQTSNLAQFATSRAAKASRPWLHFARVQKQNQQYDLLVEQGITSKTPLAASLIADVFATADVDERPTALELATYRVKIGSILGVRAASYGPQFVTVMACPAARKQGGNLAGCLTVCPGLETTGVTDKNNIPLLKDAPMVAAIANMAVAPQWRRQGIGRALLRTAESFVIENFEQPPSVFALTVYTSNIAAQELYLNEGYVFQNEWIDEKWLENAEKGRVSVQRRLLMTKQL